MVDGGFPSTTEENALKEMITPQNFAWRLFKRVADEDVEYGVRHELPMGALSKIPWRKNDVKYVANEIYFDLVESIDCIMSGAGGSVKCEVYGEIQANCKLSGNPDLTLSFTNPSIPDDCSLHRCVRINRFQRDKVLSFVPPDGKFTLLTYRIDGITNIPITVKPSIQYKKGGGTVNITVAQKFGSEKGAEELAIMIPFPKCMISSSLSCNCGVLRQDEITKVLKWEIGKYPKDKTPELRGGISLPADFLPDEAPTISVRFSVKQFSASGLKVDGLGVRGVRYKPVKGVRCITRAGRFEIRC